MPPPSPPPPLSLQESFLGQQASQLFLVDNTAASPRYGLLVGVTLSLSSLLRAARVNVNLGAFDLSLAGTVSYSSTGTTLPLALPAGFQVQAQVNVFGLFQTSVAFQLTQGGGLLGFNIQVQSSVLNAVVVSGAAHGVGDTGWVGGRGKGEAD